MGENAYKQQLLQQQQENANFDAGPDDFENEEQMSPRGKRESLAPTVRGKEKREVNAPPGEDQRVTRAMAQRHNIQLMGQIGIHAVEAYRDLVKATAEKVWAYLYRKFPHLMTVRAPNEAGPPLECDSYGLPAFKKGVKEPEWFNSRRTFLKSLPSAERNLLLTGDPHLIFDPTVYELVFMLTPNQLQQLPQPLPQFNYLNPPGRAIGRLRNVTWATDTDSDSSSSSSKSSSSSYKSNTSHTSQASWQSRLNQTLGKLYLRPSSSSSSQSSPSLGAMPKENVPVRTENYAPSAPPMEMSKPIPTLYPDLPVLEPTPHLTYAQATQKSILKKPTLTNEQLREKFPQCFIPVRPAPAPPKKNFIRQFGAISDEWDLPWTSVNGVATVVWNDGSGPAKSTAEASQADTTTAEKIPPGHHINTNENFLFSRESLPTAISYSDQGPKKEERSTATTSYSAWTKSERTAATNESRTWQGKRQGSSFTKASPNLENANSSRNRRFPQEARSSQAWRNNDHSRWTHNHEQSTRNASKPGWRHQGVRVETNLGRQTSKMVKPSQYLYIALIFCILNNQLNSSEARPIQVQQPPVSVKIPKDVTNMAYMPNKSGFKYEIAKPKPPIRPTKEDNYVVFNQIGEMATHTAYIHVALTINLTAIEQQATMLTAQIKNFTTWRTVNATEAEIRQRRFRFNIKQTIEALQPEMDRIWSKIRHLQKILPEDKDKRHKRHTPFSNLAEAAWHSLIMFLLEMICLS